MIKPLKELSNRGFTLIEMLVSAGIIGLIMAVVFFNYRSFNDNLALSAAQQEISIAIRQAQIYGLSVKESQQGSSNFDSGYGIYFSKSDQSSYYLFIDKANGGFLVNDGKYNGSSSCSGSAECVEKNNIRNGVRITNICAAVYGGVLNCGLNLNTIHVTFIRPNPDANITFDSSILKYKTGQIILTSPLGKTAFITIENTGQISVQ